MCLEHRVYLTERITKEWRGTRKGGDTNHTRQERGLHGVKDSETVF